MKNLMQKFLCVVMIAVTTFFVACEPDFVQRDETPNSSSVDFYSPEFKFILKSHLCSKQLLAAGSDGSMTYLDGAKISELGHWLLLDNVLYDTDTIYASFNPANDALVVDWEIEDPSVLEIVSQSTERNYIVVKAKKLGTTTIEASIENKSRKMSVTSTVTNAYATKMLGYDGKKGETGYRVENYTIFVNSEDPNSKRKEQKVWMGVDQTPAADEMVKDEYGNDVPAPKAPILWSVSEEGIVDISDIRGDRGDTCVIKPVAEGMVTVLATCQYRTVQILTTVKNNQVLTTIDSLQFTLNDNLFDKIWLSRGQQAFVNVACFPDNAYADYTDGYTWESLSPTTVAVETTGDASSDEFSRIIKGISAGDAQVKVSLGIGEKTKSRTFDVKVCNAVTGIAITADGTTDAQEIEVSSQKQFIAVIDDAAAAAEFGDLLTWHVEPNPDAWNAGDEVADYLTIDGDGLLSANKVTPALKNCYVYASMTYSKYPGHPTDHSTTTVTSNKIRCTVIEASTALVFNPVSLTYTYLSGDGYTVDAVFTDAGGNAMTVTDNITEGDIYRTPGTIDLSGEYYVTYDGNNFRSGTIEVVDNGDGTYTYTFNLTSSTVNLTGSATLTPDVVVE